jgi:hypothetical protein
MNLDNQENKSAIIVSQGHYYLFRSTGIFYINQLSEKYLIDLVVPREFLQIQGFFDTLKLVNIRKIYYLDETVYFKKNQTSFDKIRNYLSHFNIFSHFKIKRVCQKIFNDSFYEAYFSHDYIECEHIYLFKYFRDNNPGKPIISITSSQPSNENIIPGFKVIKSNNARAISRGIPILHEIVLGVFYLMRYFQSLFQNIILPFFVSGIFRPYLLLSAFNNIDIVPRKDFFDYMIVYEKIEKEFYDSLFNGVICVERVCHPLNGQRNLLSQLYGRGSGKNISIFFSVLGLTPGQFKQELDAWTSLIFELLAMDTDYVVSVKFHPRTNHQTIEKTSVAFQRKFGDSIAIYTGTDITAEELIYSSKIVIGDVSSTLIWAQYFDDKKVFSLVNSSYSNYQDMARYPRIILTENYKSIILAIQDSTSLECIRESNDVCETTILNWLMGIKV